MKRLYRWLTDHLPTWLLANPWEPGVLLIAFARGVFYLTQLTPASAAEQSVPQPLLFALLGCYAASATFTAYHYARGNLLMERAGLIAVGPIALAYGLTILAAEPRKGLYSFVLYLIVAGMCFLRGAIVIPKLIRIQQSRLVKRR